jgi:hypothetical protein
MFLPWVLAIEGLFREMVGSGFSLELTVGSGIILSAFSDRFFLENNASVAAWNIKFC